MKTPMTMRTVRRKRFSLLLGVGAGGGFVALEHVGESLLFARVLRQRS